jgi:hypothetical protein
LPNGSPSRIFEFSRFRGRVARTPRSGRGLIDGIADGLREGAFLRRLLLRGRLDLSAGLCRPLRDWPRPSLLWRPALGGWRRRSAGTQHNHIGWWRGRWLTGPCHGAAAAEHLVQKLIDVVWFHRIHSSLHRPTRRRLLSRRRITLLLSIPQQGFDQPHTENNQRNDEVEQSTDWRGEEYHDKLITSPEHSRPLYELIALASPLADRPGLAIAVRISVSA